MCRNNFSFGLFLFVCLCFTGVKKINCLFSQALEKALEASRCHSCDGSSAENSCDFLLIESKVENEMCDVYVEGVGVH